MSKYYNSRDKVQVEVVDKCKIQFGDIWIDAVIYEDLEGTKYCCATAEFNSKFKKDN